VAASLRDNPGVKKTTRTSGKKKKKRKRQPPNDKQILLQLSEPDPRGHSL